MIGLVSIISEEMWRRVFPGASLKPSTTLLRTYTGEPMRVAGQMEVQGQVWIANTETSSVGGGRKWTNPFWT